MQSSSFDRGKTLTLIRSTIVFAIVTTVIWFSFGSVSTELAIAVVVLVAAAVFSYGLWLGHRWPGRTTGYYFFVGTLLGLSMWILHMILGFRRAESLGLNYDPTVSFVRVALFGALLCTGGAMFGDMMRRRKPSLDSTLVATAISAIGALTGILQLFK